MNKWQLQGSFSNLEFNKPVLLLIVLWVLVVLQAVAVIYTKQIKRITHARIQSTYAAQDKLQIAWSQLLLEQGTWQADARVERIARDKLGMVVPDKVNVIVP